MNHRERIKAIIAGQKPDRCGFWLGNPVPQTLENCLAYFGSATEEQLRRRLNDDLRWICPQFMKGVYRSPDGSGLFKEGLSKDRHGQDGPFAAFCEASQIDSWPWPNPDRLDFEPAIDRLRNAGDVYRASGMWTCFYHNVMDLFGIESYLMNMICNPELVHAVTDKVCGFYLEANERFYDAAGELIDGFFFGNDFGTQQDLICGPAQFDEFILPWIKKFTDQAHQHGYQVILHSCGSIYKIIDRLIDANVDCLHPLQANAANMDACTLARDFKGKISFMGGVDTQDLLVNAAPDQVKAEVIRLKEIFGDRFVVSPSHEALLPDVPPENVKAMALAVLE